MKTSDNCPCASGKPYGECCGPIIGGERKAATASELMRARYSAYAVGDVKFLYNSSGPEVQAEFDEKTTREWANKQACEHRERSYFKRIDGDWRFIDGQIDTGEPWHREEPKVGRNDPCPCGSGKKYKKCCGKGA